MSRDVVPCAKPTKGMYLHQAGFVTFDSAARVSKANGADVLKISLEFRATSVEGLLLAVLTNSRPEGTRLTLEMRQQQVMVTLTHDDSGLEMRDALPMLRPLCDSQWHSLYLVLDPETARLTLEIDGVT